MTNEGEKICRLILTSLFTAAIITQTGETGTSTIEAAEAITNELLARNQEALEGLGRA